MAEIGSGDSVRSGDNMQCPPDDPLWPVLDNGQIILSLRAQTFGCCWRGEEKNPIWRITGISSNCLNRRRGGHFRHYWTVYIVGCADVSSARLACRYMHIGYFGLETTADVSIKDKQYRKRVCTNACLTYDGIYIYT